MTKDQARDKRLRKLYGITLEEYNLILASQMGQCAVCHRAPVTRSLSVDHDHSWKYLKTYVCEGGPQKYVSRVQGRMNPPDCYDSCAGYGETRTEARRILKSQLRRESCRGLLCHNCNLGIRRFHDSPINLDRAAAYLRRHQQPTETK